MIYKNIVLIDCIMFRYSTLKISSLFMFEIPWANVQNTRFHPVSLKIFKKVIFKVQMFMYNSFNLLF